MRRVFFLLSSIVLLAAIPAGAQPAASSYRPEARALFGKCTAMAEGSRGRYYTCPNGVSSSITWVAMEQDLSPSQLLELFRVGIVSVIKGEVATEPSALTLAGRELQALKVEVRAAKGQPLQHSGHMVVDKQPGGSWMYLCLANTGVVGAAKDCLKKLEFYAKQGVPETVDLKASPPPEKPVIFGRELVVPEGCKLSTPNKGIGSIQCPTSFLNWTFISPMPDLQKWLKESVEVYRKQFTLELKATPVDCNLEKVPGSCVLLESGGPGPMFRMLIGVRQHEQQGVQLSCIYAGETVELPATCNGLLERLPAAAADAGTPPAPGGSPDAGRK